MLRAMLLAALTTMPAPVNGGVLTADPSPPMRGVVAAPTGSVAMPKTGWTWPLEPAPAVVRPFHPPPTPWSAGHRGVDLAASPGQPVLAVGAGRVTFAGPVAGRGVVVVTHEDSSRTSYEPVTAAPPVGLSVRAGTPIGVVAPTPGHCSPGTCLHLGLRRGENYLDPLTLFGRGPPILKPLGRR